MQIRHATIQDLPQIMKIYAHARTFMSAHGNPRQWGDTNWPPESLIREDIRTGRCYLCVDQETEIANPHPDHPAETQYTASSQPQKSQSKQAILGVFFYDYGDHIEPCYNRIEDGSWQSDKPYGVVHRIASSGSVKGVGKYCIRWAIAQAGTLRMDTHPDNVIMQSLLSGLGFTKCGIIHVEEDDDPRYAYEIDCCTS